ncbi:myogenic factor 6-like [Branchiostoma lanceolatum]|uniref:myogenic factor 6-like n=1 Tax=Branchiostoma lanceolatum TaxID=7740 RepID=UPI0034531118
MPQHSYYGEGQLLGWSNKTYKRRRERQRVAELNDALSRLKQLVPSVRELPFPNRGRGHDRLTKVGILRAAVGYIRHMQETLRTDVSEAVLKEGRTHGGDLLRPKLAPSEADTDLGRTQPARLASEFNHP